MGHILPRDRADGLHPSFAAAVVEHGDAQFVYGYAMRHLGGSDDRRKRDTYVVANFLLSGSVVLGNPAGDSG
jgi:hypothetical protein